MSVSPPSEGCKTALDRPRDFILLGVLRVLIGVGVGLLAAGTAKAGLPLADREWIARFQHVRQQIAEGRLSEALPTLEQMLRQAPEPYGYVLWDAEQNLFVPLRQAAAMILESLPPEGQEQAERFLAPRAEHALKEAASQADRRRLRQLVVEYPVSRVGAEAALLLAADAWDRGDWWELHGWAQRVLRNPRSTGQQRAQAALWLVCTSVYQGRMDQARQAAQTLLNLPEAKQLTIAGRPLQGLQSPEQLIQQLGMLGQNLSGQQSLVAGSGAEAASAGSAKPASDVQKVEVAGSGTEAALSKPVEWTMWRGQPSRNGQMVWTGQLGQRRWQVPMQEVKQWLGEIRPSPLDPPGRFPVWQPLLWQNMVVVRFPSRLLAVDLRTGRQLWQYPLEGDPVLQQWGALCNLSLSLEGSSPEKLPLPIKMLVGQRIYDDHLYARMSVHQSRLFFVEDLNLPEAMTFSIAPPAQGAAATMNYQPPERNRLIALDLRREGKLLWAVGGPSGEDEPALAGAFFLDAPFVLEDRLYVLAERRQEILLAALSPQSGQLLWSLPIAMVEEGQAISKDTRRRLSGLCLAYADGLLICPTGAGQIVAVDLLSRSILWAYQYAPAVTMLPLKWQPIFGPGGALVPFNPLLQPALNFSFDFSLEHCPIIAQSLVVMAPADAEEMFCLELSTGKLRWRRKVEKLRYLGGVAEQVVLTVHTQWVSAWNLSTGKPAWEEIRRGFPAGYFLAGRGFQQDRRYYLPVARGPSGAILVLDIPTGRWEQPILLPPKTRPGTLAAFGERLLCYSPDGLEAFGPAEPKPY